MAPSAPAGPGISAGVPGCRVPSCSMPTPHQTHLGCPRLRGAGGRGGAPSGTRPPAPWCSLRLRPHGFGWTRLGGRRARRGEGAGRSAPERAPCEGAGGCLGGLFSALWARWARWRGISAPQLHSCTSSRQPSSSTSSSSCDWEQARSQLAPPHPLQPHSSKSLGVATPSFTFSLSRRRPGVRRSQRSDARVACSSSHPFPWRTPKRRGGCSHRLRRESGANALGCHP